MDSMGLDNIGNNTLSGSSWWKNLDSYEDSLSIGEEHNGRVDDAESAALTQHLQTSASNIRSFMSNGLGIDVESLLGADLVDLSQRDVSIDFGATRAFSSESVTITLRQDTPRHRWRHRSSLSEHSFNRVSLTGLPTLT